MNRILLIALPLLLIMQTGARAADLSLSDAFSRATPGTAAPGVAYLTIHGGDAPDRLVRVASPLAGVAVHTMTMQDNVMRMRQVDAIDVPAGATVKLAPGGLHLMLMGLKAPLKPGDTIPLVLTFEHAGVKNLNVPVGALGATAPAK